MPRHQITPFLSNLLGIFVLCFWSAHASYVSSGYTVPDLVLGAADPNIPLLVEPAAADEFKKACPTPSKMCPRIAHIPVLKLDQRDLEPAKLREVSSEQLSQSQKDAGAKTAFFIYDYNPQVIENEMWDTNDREFNLNYHIASATRHSTCQQVNILHRSRTMHKALLGRNAEANSHHGRITHTKTSPLPKTRSAGSMVTHRESASARRSARSWTAAQRSGSP
jgi:hypothetical protein